MNLTWSCLPFADLSLNELYELLQLRSRVFVVEQNCVFLDADNLDQPTHVRHVLGKNTHGKLCAYARISLPHAAEKRCVISRVMTAPDMRGTGCGHALMREVLHRCRQSAPSATLTLSGQNHLRDFYRAHGFVPQGEVYLEDGIEHIRMDYAFQAA
ncbi:MAG: GNAT family N-acetyltransferase [Neisseria sp.]|nr:GNAT family N-acetyltransferase [Neisseria sp.]